MLSNIRCSFCMFSLLLKEFVKVLALILLVTDRKIFAAIKVCDFEALTKFLQLMARSRCGSTVYCIDSGLTTVYAVSVERKADLRDFLRIFSQT